jgi:hypothetical protein
MLRMRVSLHARFAPSVELLSRQLQAGLMVRRHHRSKHHNQSYHCGNHGYDKDHGVTDVVGRDGAEVVAAAELVTGADGANVGTSVGDGFAGALLNQPLFAP